MTVILMFVGTLAAAFIGSCAGYMFMEAYYDRRDYERVNQYEYAYEDAC